MSLVDRSHRRSGSVTSSIADVWLQTLQAYNGKAAASKTNEQLEAEVNEHLDHLLNRSSKHESAIPPFYQPPPPPVAQPSADTTAADTTQALPPTLQQLLLRHARQQYIVQTSTCQVLNDEQLELIWQQLQQFADKEQAAEKVRRKSIAGGSQQPASKAPPTMHDDDAFTSSMDDSSVSDSLIMHSDASKLNATKALHYQQFVQCGQHLHTLLPSQLHSLVDTYFSSASFSKFPLTSTDGSIGIHQFFLYVQHMNNIEGIHLSLLCYDEGNKGYLTEHELENYIYDQISATTTSNNNNTTSLLYSQLQGLEVEFYPYYVFTAVSKFFFYQDSQKRGKLLIDKLVHSTVMSEFYSLRQSATHTAYPTLNVHTRKKQWFSLQHTHHLYSLYLSLDTNQNGMLDLQEFQRFNGGSLTQMFIQQVYQTYRMYMSVAAVDVTNTSAAADPQADSSTSCLEMDYKSFLEFMLAWEYRTTTSSIRWFWRVLMSVNSSKNYLDAESIKLWFTAVRDKLMSLNHPAPDVQHVTLEIFDMVTPRVDGQITLQDMIDSQVGHTVIQILTDVNGFWRYDNRETLMHQAQEEE